jgi:hypothetical protein
MKTVRYSTRNKWAGTMKCPSCAHVVRAWRSSGMSDIAPHFYCDSCSNAIHREVDKEVSRDQQTDQILCTIANSLPECPCGGQFRPSANPKCPKCHEEFRHSASALQRLTDPHVILIDGACFYSDREPYRVKISPFYL